MIYYNLFSDYNLYMKVKASHIFIGLLTILIVLALTTSIVGLFSSRREGMKAGMGPLNIRYVRVAFPNGVGKCIQIAQIAVYSGGMNVAIGKTTSSSDPYTVVTSSGKAIDGTLQSRHYPNILHSKCDPGNFWELDLTQEYPVDKLVYYNRLDCCNDQADGMMVTLMDNNRTILQTIKLSDALTQSFVVEGPLKIVPTVSSPLLDKSSTESMAAPDTTTDTAGAVGAAAAGAAAGAAGAVAGSAASGRLLDKYDSNYRDRYRYDRYDYERDLALDKKNRKKQRRYDKSQHHYKATAAAAAAAAAADTANDIEELFDVDAADAAMNDTNFYIAPAGDTVLIGQPPAHAPFGNALNETYQRPYNTQPPLQMDDYILKSQIVPPVCPATPAPCPSLKQGPYPPCPPCARCPEPAFECKKVPNYAAASSGMTSMLGMTDGGAMLPGGGGGAMPFDGATAGGTLGSSELIGHGGSNSSSNLPRPVLASFSAFGM